MNWIFLRTFPDRTLAELAVSALKAAGIDARVQSALTPVPYPGTGDVWVNSEQVSSAIAVLDTIAKSD